MANKSTITFEMIFAVCFAMACINGLGMIYHLKKKGVDLGSTRAKKDIAYVTVPIILIPIWLTNGLKIETRIIATAIFLGIIAVALLLKRIAGLFKAG